MTYDESAFNDALNENMADDPYSTATFIISQALKGAADHMMTMSSDEAMILNDVGQLLLKLDPHVVVPSPAEWDLEVDDPDTGEADR